DGGCSKGVVASGGGKTMFRKYAQSRIGGLSYVSALILLVVSANAWAISVSPAWAPAGNYTVSWSTPTRCQYYYSPYYPYPPTGYDCWYLQEKVGSASWTTPSPSVPDGSTSWNATGKPEDTYQYQILHVFG